MYVGPTGSRTHVPIESLGAIQRSRLALSIGGPAPLLHRMWQAIFGVESWKDLFNAVGMLPGHVGRGAQRQRIRGYSSVGSLMSCEVRSGRIYLGSNVGDLNSTLSAGRTGACLACSP